MLIIIKNLWNYFKAVENKWPNAWKPVKRGNILNRTTGFAALMRFLPHIIFHYKKFDSILTLEEYAAILDRVTLQEADFKPKRYNPGSTGEGELLKDLLEMTSL